MLQFLLRRNSPAGRRAHPCPPPEFARVMAGASLPSAGIRPRDGGRIPAPLGADCNENKKRPRGGLFCFVPRVNCKQAYIPDGEQNKTSIETDACSCFRDPAGIQTRNLLIRSQMLYSVKLRNRRASLKAVQRYGLFWNLEYFKTVFLIKNINNLYPIL